ncbi:ATP-binding protein [Nannocystis exedens]|uniref:ATP-binding protein n=1 Tax=Nannocystis exedens TaxID=54 RepID=UPI001FE41B4D
MPRCETSRLAARSPPASNRRTSNRAVEEWGPLFKDEQLASAAVDRLLHHSHVLVMDGETYRNPRTHRAQEPTAP